MAVDALTALNRFGLGARPGDLARPGKDPRAYVMSLVDPAAVKPLEGQPGFLPLSSTQDSIIAIRLFQIQQDIERAKPVVVAANMVTGPATMADAAGSAPAMLANGAAALPVKPPAAGAAVPAPKAGTAAAPTPAAVQPVAAAGQPQQPLLKPQPPGTQIVRSEVAARFQRLTTADNGLVERLVLFWSNHFAIGANKTPAGALGGCYEREAIRPFVLGRFGDMLKAVEQHPAMLAYLDNTGSIGPNSRNGLNSKRGLNENLAREILELHTLGVGGGYKQEDVTSLARIITGWTVTNADDDILHGGRFTFAPARHEPGDHAVLGKTYKEDGTRQGEAVLADLAVHPSTARHIATKLVRHFVADQPPASLVDKLAKTFLDTRGDLAAVTKALVAAPESWAAPADKLRTPQEFVVAALRAVGKVPDPGAITGVLGILGQPLWQPGGPNGFSDLSAEWATPEGIAARLDAAVQWGRQNAGLDPLPLVDAVIGPTCSAETKQAISRAESRGQALALLFMSPEFQRR